MKAWMFALITLSLLASGPSFALTVGKVDIQKILVSVNQGKAVRAKLKKEFEKKQKTIKAEENKIRKSQASFKKQSLVMNDKAKVKKERAIQQKIIALQQKTMQFQKEIQGMEAKLKKPIIDKVRKIIDSVSKKAGVEFTYEISAAPIVYAKSTKDLTDAVVKAYNKKHK